MENNKVFVLSTNPDSIIFPSLDIDNKNINNIYINIIEYMRTFLMTHQLELSPQLITTDNTIISSNKKHTLNLVYGLLIKEGIKNFNSHWIEINLLDSETKYGSIIIEVIQKLK